MRPDGPRTIEQLERRDERRAKAAEQAEQERQARLAALRKDAAPVTFGQVEPTARGLTLAEAGRRIADAGGKVEAKDGRLLVSLPVSAGGDPAPLGAARMLYAAEAVVVEHLAAKRPLPDRQALPTGALAPE